MLSCRNLLQKQSIACSPKARSADRQTDGRIDRQTGRHRGRWRVRRGENKVPKLRRTNEKLLKRNA